MNLFTTQMARSMSSDYRVHSDMNKVRISTIMKRLLGEKNKYLNDEEIEKVKDIWAAMKQKEMIQALLKITFDKQDALVKHNKKDKIKITNFTDMEELNSLDNKYYLTKKYLYETYPSLMKNIMAIKVRAIRVRLQISEILTRGFLRNATEWFLIKFILFQLSDMAVGEFFGIENATEKHVELDGNTAFNMSNEPNKIGNEEMIKNTGQFFKKTILKKLFNIEVTSSFMKTNDPVLLILDEQDDVAGRYKKTNVYGRMIWTEIKDSHQRKKLDVFELVNDGITKEDIQMVLNEN